MTLPKKQIDIFGDNSSSDIDDAMSVEKDNKNEVEMSSVSGNDSDAEELSYEEALDRLEKVVAQLESGETALDESMELFQDGIKLTDYCTAKLNMMEEKITKLMTQADGSVDESSLEEHS